MREVTRDLLPIKRHQPRSKSTSQCLHCQQQQLPCRGSTAAESNPSLLAGHGWVIETQGHPYAGCHRHGVGAGCCCTSSRDLRARSQPAPAGVSPAATCMKGSKWAPGHKRGPAACARQGWTSVAHAAVANSGSGLLLLHLERLFMIKFRHRTSQHPVVHLQRQFARSRSTKLSRATATPCLLDMGGCGWQGKGNGSLRYGVSCAAPLCVC